MRLRLLFLLFALAFALPGCVIHSVGPGAVASDGSVYLGFDLFDAKGKPDREQYYVGQELGPFSSIRVISGEPVDITRVRVVFADGERFDAPVPRRLNGSSQDVALPGSPRAIHSIVVAAKSVRKGLAKIEIYGRR